MTPAEAQAAIADGLARAFPCVRVVCRDEEGCKVVTAVWPASGDGTAIIVPHSFNPASMDAAISRGIERLWECAPIAGSA